MFSISYSPKYNLNRVASIGNCWVRVNVRKAVEAENFQIYFQVMEHCFRRCVTSKEAILKKMKFHYNYVDNFKNNTTRLRSILKRLGR